jgi:hypothetical protein
VDLLPFFEWCEATFIGEFIRNSFWLFPAIESVHLLALALIGGTILLVDLRLLGLGLTVRPPAELAREIHPWLVASLATMLVTGIPLFLSEAVKCYHSQPFWVKMEALALAMIFTFTIRRKVAASDEAGFKGRAVAVVSIVLWGTVAWGGRWIGFSG